MENPKRVKAKSYDDLSIYGRVFCYCGEFVESIIGSTMKCFKKGKKSLDKYVKLLDQSGAFDNERDLSINKNIGDGLEE